MTYWPDNNLFELIKGGGGGGGGGQESLASYLSSREPDLEQRVKNAYSPELPAGPAHC